MDDYGLPDLRQLMASRANFGTPGIHLPPDSFRHFTPPPPPPPPPHFLVVGGDQQLVVPGGGSLVDHHHYNNNTLTTATSAAAPPHPPTTAMLYGNNGSDQLEHVSWGNNNNMDDGGNNSSRWPRQETLTLLEIRSALDSSFKETNHKGPLWDQVSRIMGEEHGYQRSGKKCKEKFENLYKYYKKTKEGKAGRQDGKNYRFFRQLEAIYGDHHQTRLAPPTFINPLAPNRDFHFENNQEIVVQHHQHQGLDSFSNNSAEFDQTSSSENNSCARPVVKKRWREKVEGFVSSQIGKVMKAQEEWMEKMVKSIEQREEERMVEEEERRKREAARFDHQVNEFWAKERAWVEARDAAMMKALSKNPRKEIVNSWSQHEVASLIELRTNLELRIQQEGGRRCLKEGIWEEIAMKMGCLGYTRSVGECKEKWEDIKMSNMYFSRLSFYDHEGGEISRERWPEGMMRLQLMDDQGISPASSSKPDVSSSSFRIPSNGGENLWEESRYR